MTARDEQILRDYVAGEVAEHYTEKYGPDAGQRVHQALTTPPAPLTSEREAEIRKRAEAEHLTAGPWRLECESCDCGGDYGCGHGLYPSAVVTKDPTPFAAERAKRTGEAPRDYDFHRTEMSDFTRADWELMAHAREDVPALLAALDAERARAAELAAENARLQAANKRSVECLVARTEELMSAEARIADLEAEVAEERPVDAGPIRDTSTAPEGTPAGVAADEIRAMDTATVTSCTALTDALLLTLTPRTVADWRLWVDLLGIDWAQVTHRGGTSTGRGSWNGVPVAVRAVGLSALLLNEAPAEAGEPV